MGDGKEENKEENKENSESAATEGEAASGEDDDDHSSAALASVRTSLAYSSIASAVVVWEHGFANMIMNFRSVRQGLQPSRLTRWTGR